MFNETIMPALDWIRLEIKIKYNAKCIYCPHSYFRKTRDMPMEIFYVISSCLSNTNLVYLKGWGELTGQVILFPQIIQLFEYNLAE
jgi:hypothetical protein